MHLCSRQLVNVNKSDRSISGVDFIADSLIACLKRFRFIPLSPPHFAPIRLTSMEEGFYFFCFTPPVRFHVFSSAKVVKAIVMVVEAEGVQVDRGDQFWRIPTGVGSEVGGLGL